MPVYKIAIAGASTLLGRELKEALEESPLATASFVLLDEEAVRGQLGDEITFVHAIEEDSFERVDFTFFCGTEALTRKHWRRALRAGSTVLDLSGALDQETGVLVRAPWLGSEAVSPDLFTPAVVPAHPAALALALVLDRLQQAAPVRFAAATLLLPASESGRAAMDELHQQTVSLLSFQDMPRAIFDAQVAYNLLTGLGESAVVSLTAVEARIRRHYDALANGRWPAWSWSRRWQSPRWKRLSAASTLTWCLKTRIRPQTWPPPGKTMSWSGCAPKWKARARPAKPPGSGCGPPLTICG
jgi:aspartate-semialdehyde dehydrogenase